MAAILLAEDDESMRRFLKKALEKAGHAVVDPDMKIMFITGFAAVALNPANRAPEEAKVLSKPFHLKDLVQEVERMVAA